MTRVREGDQNANILLPLLNTIDLGINDDPDIETTCR